MSDQKKYRDLCEGGVEKKKYASSRFSVTRDKSQRKEKI